jgi:3-phenylpropionate/trans-cinnamate dioxygenase ferredoxin reductase subunit
MKGLDVTMVAPEPVLWSHLFGEQVGRYFQGHMERHGVQLTTGSKELPDGDYDMVIAGIGVQPNIELARAAGLETGSGVLADDHLKAVDDIWVAGDIAEYQSAIHGRRIRIEHWDVALNQGGYVGKTWAGAESGPYMVVPYFFSDLADWTWFEYVGPVSPDDDIEVRGSMEDDDFVAYYSRDGRLTGCLGVNRSDDVEAAKQLIVDGAGVPAA